MNKTQFFSSLLLLGSSLAAYGWGQKGHDTVAFIGEQHLTSATKSAIDSLLDGKSIVYYANWLDNASHTPDYSYSKTWHYKNIDADVEYEEAPSLDSGDIVTALESQIRILADNNLSKEDKALALKMVVHLLGDVHQPMHVGHASDRGGNQWQIKYFGKPNNLHSVWDSSLPESAHKWSYTEWQNQIDRATEEEEMQITSGGNPDKWAKETFEICKQVYDTTPEGYNISYDYIAEWTPVIEQQFLKGGLRLADVLNSVFDPSYIPRNSIFSGNK
ncbi:MAG: S1/P1 nuclease [Muribaculaceae bacterium]|nr:S1/P1 nuclease [Muribaculaceae bacterium]